MPSVIAPAPAAPPSSTPDARATAWPSAVWALLIGTFAVRAAGFVYPYLAYHLAEREVAASTVTLILALFGAGWLAGQLACGALADRIGRRATLAGAMFTAAVAFPVLAQSHTVAALAAASFVAGLVYDAPRPIVSAVIADTVQDEPTRARIAGWRHFATNLGAAATGAIGGMLAAPLGFPVLFLVNALVCALFAVVTFSAVPAPARRTTTAPPQGSYKTAFADMRLILLWLASVCAFVPVTALYAVLPLMMADDGLPPSAYGWSQAAGAVAVLILSPLMNGWLARRASGPSPMVGLLAVGSGVLGLGMGSAGLASTSTGYAAAVVLAVPGEIIAFVAAADVLNRISPAHSRGLYAGIWGTTLAAAVLLAPLLAGACLATGGHLLVALALTGCGLAGAAACLPLKTLTHRTQPTSAH
ncbi:MFS transporter [Streptomyces parvus]|uniref:MFS transporter n=1 Tax=Streptomyces parvus TaxID=66428 RepID=UPI00210180B2|nr:MFS transporter [Streptomyces parvus]MCQ1577175.1 MFS transporter [Streptomyces parvus]